MLDEKLLEILVCPACHAQVEQRAERLFCQNDQCGLVYPIRDGIPIMLIDEAEKKQD